MRQQGQVGLLERARFDLTCVCMCSGSVFEVHIAVVPVNIPHESKHVLFVAIQTRASAKTVDTGKPAKDRKYQPPLKATARTIQLSERLLGSHPLIQPNLALFKLSTEHMSRNFTPRLSYCILSRHFVQILRALFNWARRVQHVHACQRVHHGQCTLPSRRCSIYIGQVCE